MTDQEINRTIAESLGWKRIMGDWYRPNANCQYVTRSSSDGGYVIYPPNYLNDLNAMYEVESSLLRTLIPEYQLQLRYVTKEGMASDWNLIHATAAQRAEAYLRTIGKWNEKD